MTSAILADLAKAEIVRRGRDPWRYPVDIGARGSVIIYDNGADWHHDRPTALRRCVLIRRGPREIDVCHFVTRGSERDGDWKTVATKRAHVGGRGWPGRLVAFALEQLAPAAPAPPAVAVRDAPPPVAMEWQQGMAGDLGGGLTTADFFDPEDR